MGRRRCVPLAGPTQSRWIMGSLCGQERSSRRCEGSSPASLTRSRQVKLVQGGGCVPGRGGWDEAEVAWLEGQVHRALQGLPGVSLSNTQAPGSGRLAPRRQMPLLTVSVILAGVLALIGHPVAGGDTQDESPPKPRGPQRIAGLSRLGRLADLLEAELLTSGARLVTRDPRWPGEGVVTAEGWIDVAGEGLLVTVRSSQSPQRTQAEAGWDFWAVESADGPTLNRTTSPPHLRLNDSTHP